MAGKKWKDLTSEQKAKGIEILKQQSRYILWDENDILIRESDVDFIERLKEEWLYETVLGLFQNRDALTARRSRIDI